MSLLKHQPVNVSSDEHLPLTGLSADSVNPQLLYYLVLLKDAGDVVQMCCLYHYASIQPPLKMEVAGSSERKEAYQNSALHALHNNW
jgi:hypothetical protein